MRPPVSRETLFPALLAGITAGLILFVTAWMDVGGTLLLFLPSFCLLLAGLALGPAASGVACLTAALMAALLLKIDGALFFMICFAFPTWYFTRRALRWRGNPAARQWYPALSVLTELTIVAAGLFMMAAMGLQAQGGLGAAIPHITLPPEVVQQHPEAASDMQDFLNGWSFFIYAFLGWSWILIIYLMAIMANRLLVSNTYALRPSLALEPHGLSGWLLLLLVISGALTVVTKAQDRYTAEVIFLLLLLPYFLCGLAWIHSWSLHYFLRLRRFWITSFYIALILIGWPVLFVVALGLYRQLTEMLDRRKGIG